MWVFVIAGEHSDFLKRTLPDLNSVFDPAWVEKIDVADSAALVMLRNTLLMFKIFNNDRLREARICFEGFDHFAAKYPQFCVNSAGEPMHQKP